MALSTRERLINVGHEMFYQSGFHSVGLDRLLSEVGVTKTTFYNHFESKEDLILAVLQQHDQWWRKTFMKQLEEKAGPDPAAQLRAIFDVVDDLLKDETFKGCIFVNVSVEFPIPHEPAHKLAAEHKAQLEAQIRDLALRARAKDPVALAEQITLLMEGAYVTTQVSGNRNAASIARAIADLIFNDQLPPAKA